MLLNSSNPAFSEETPWKDGINCLKFDGSADGLMTCLQRAFSLGRHLDTVTLPAIDQPWHISPPAVDVSSSKETSWPRVSVILVNQSDGLNAADSLESVARQSYPNVEVIYVDDNSSDAASAVLREQLEISGTPGLSIIRQPVTTGVAAARNRAVQMARGDYILFMNPGDLLADGFLEEASSALSKEPEFDIFVSQCGVYDNIDDTVSPDLLQVETFAGEAPISGSVLNHYSDGPRLCRKDIATRVQHRPHLGSLCDWGWMRDAVSEGGRVIACPRTSAFVRNRITTDFAEPIADRDRLHHLLIASSPSADRTFPIAALAQVVHGGGFGVSPSKLPAWQVHMNEHGYEEEVEFVASVLGRTKLGRTIRTNKFVSRVLERSIRWLAGLE